MSRFALCLLLLAGCQRGAEQGKAKTPAPVAARGPIGLLEGFEPVDELLKLQGTWVSGECTDTYHGDQFERRCAGDPPDREVVSIREPGRLTFEALTDGGPSEKSTYGYGFEDGALHLGAGYSGMVLPGGPVIPMLSPPGLVAMRGDTCTFHKPRDAADLTRGYADQGEPWQCKKELVEGVEAISFQLPSDKPEKEWRQVFAVGQWLMSKQVLRTTLRRPAAAKP